MEDLKVMETLIANINSNTFCILTIAGLIVMIPIAYVSGFKKAVKIIYEQHGIKKG